MKIKHLKVATLCMAVAMLSSSCLGSFKLFNTLAQWNTKATKNKFLNEIIFLVISPVYAICGTADFLVLNSIEFWTGDNPIAQNVGKTQNVMGKDGKYYAVKTLKDGYEITKPDGEMLKFIYDQKKDSWSQVSNGKTTEIFRFNDDGSIQANMPDGEKMNITLDEAGVYKTTMAVNGNMWAMR